MVEAIFRAVELIKKAHSPLILSGAGLSAESGVPTFRSTNGLWKNYNPQQLATPEAFTSNPALVWEWYDWRRQHIASCRPNRAHQILSSWENKFPTLWQISQNVDDLLERAGSKKVIKIHGSIFHTTCLQENKTIENREVPLSKIPPTCAQCGGMLRPAVVWFGEAIPAVILSKCFELVESTDLLLIIGTSGVVFPAAGFASTARRKGAAVIEINIENTAHSAYSDIFLQGKAVEIMGEIDARL